MSGGLALSAVEMRTWESMTGNIVRREEWAIIRDMDGAYLRGAASLGSDGAPARSSSNELAPAAFDAVFG